MVYYVKLFGLHLIFGGYAMFEKDLNISYLLDFYGDLLNERKRSVIEMYYNEDYSLAEIAEEIGISRQGVRNIIKTAEADLRFYEEKLGLAKRLRLVEKHAATLSELAKAESLPEPLKQEILELANAIIES